MDRNTQALALVIVLCGAALWMLLGGREAQEDTPRAAPPFVADTPPEPEPPPPETVPEPEPPARPSPEEPAKETPRPEPAVIPPPAPEPAPVPVKAPTSQPAPAKPEPRAPEPEKGEPPAPVPEVPAVPEPPTLLDTVRANPRLFRDLVLAAREYFDLEVEHWIGRKQFLAELTKHAAAGRFFLKDMDALRWLVAQGRWFEPVLTDRKWQRREGIRRAKRHRTGVYSLSSEHLRFTFAVPQTHGKRKDLGRYPRREPYPLLLTLHEKQDFTGNDHPGYALLQRRYPKQDWKPLYKDWLVLCPVAAAGNFVSRTGTIRPGVLREPLAEYWRHYHVDFDRIVLDGTRQAFDVATSMPVFFSGIVLRGAWTLTSEQRAQVRNLASVPVFVCGSTALAQQLTDAGHAQVTVGSEATLLAWMNARRRRTPRSFGWTIGHLRYDQVLPYWVNVDSPDWGAARRALEVLCVDTEAAPNTIRIRAEGVHTLSLFLNDDIVDLDRPVRVEVNGHLEHDAVLRPEDRELQAVGRDLDFYFNREPVRIRSSLYYGWLYPARVTDIAVRPPR